MPSYSITQRKAIVLFISEHKETNTCCGCNNPDGSLVERVGCGQCGAEYTLCGACVEEDECPFCHTDFASLLTKYEKIVVEREQAADAKVAAREKLSTLRLGDLKEWDE